MKVLKGRNTKSRWIRHLCLSFERQVIWFDGVACWGNSACYSSVGIPCTTKYQKK
jgi:hypothetical protein